MEGKHLLSEAYLLRLKLTLSIWQLPFLLTKMKPKEEAETDPDGMKHV